MRKTRFHLVCAFIAISTARAQTAVVTGRVVLRETGEPVGFASVMLMPQGIQRLGNEDGSFLVRDLPSGEVRLRFRRIGFALKDTALVVAPNDTARIQIELARLAIQLPAVAINGTCTDRTPLEEKPAILAQLFDQVQQNGERLRLLAKQRSFEIRAVRVQGIRANALTTDTIVRGPLSVFPYVPKAIYRRFGNVWGVSLPELADVADTSFTNNHCLWYAGQESFASDSVIRVDFEPVPWLAKEVDLEGSLYLRVNGYQLVGMVTRLNRMPREFRGLDGYATRARFDELVPGVPVLAEWELTNTFRGARVATVVEKGRVLGIQWLDSLTIKRDTIRP